MGYLGSEWEVYSVQYVCLMDGFWGGGLGDDDDDDDDECTTTCTLGSRGQWR